MTDIGTVIDTLRDLLEPTPTTVVKNDALAEPPRFDPNTLYAWPVREVFGGDDTGYLDKEDFTVRIAYGADRGSETEAGTRDRAVSLAVLAKANAYRSIVRVNRTRPDELWGHLAVAAIDWDRLRGFDARGFLMDITGWRIPAD